MSLLRLRLSLTLRSVGCTSTSAITTPYDRGTDSHQPYQKHQQHGKTHCEMLKAII